mgnify:CR=1 FL=1
MASRTHIDEVRRLVQLAVNEPQRVPGLSASEIDLLIRLLRSQRLHGRLAADLKRMQCLESMPVAARDQLESALVMARARARWPWPELQCLSWHPGSRCARLPLVDDQPDRYVITLQA